MAELRAGGLAITIDSAAPEDIGKCVHTVSLIPSEGRFISPQSRPTVNSSEIASWLITGDVTAKLGKESPLWAGKGWALYPPQYLLPIDGNDFSDEDQRQNTREHA
jgi:hypothetical protein